MSAFEPGRDSALPLVLVEELSDWGFGGYGTSAVLNPGNKGTEVS